MNLQVEMKLNKDQAIKAIFQGTDLQECIHQAGVLLSHDGVCGNCKKTEFELSSRKSDGNLFTEFTCKSCGFRRRFGTYKDKSGNFLKEWEPPYSKAQEPTKRPPQRKVAPQQDNMLDSEDVF